MVNHDAPRRIVVIGTSGAGKSTFAQALAAEYGVAHIELDALHWLPNWGLPTTDDFRQRTSTAVAADAWVVDGNYSVVRDIVWSRATDVVWLNFSRLTIASRILRRTIRRIIARDVLWAGNRESVRQAFFSKDSIVLYSLTTFDRNRKKFATLRASSAFPTLTWHELRSPGDAAALLECGLPDGD
jgi:adenylate kinase family enzyme